MYLPYSPGELAAWAMKPFWGLHENLLPEPDLLEGSLEAVILLVAHAFRLGLTLSVAALYPLEEFLTFAEAQPIYTQTLLDQQFNFDNFLLNISMVIPRLIRGRLVWPRLRQGGGCCDFPNEKSEESHHHHHLGLHSRQTTRALP